MERRSLSNLTKSFGGISINIPLQHKSSKKKRGPLPSSIIRPHTKGVGKKKIKPKVRTIIKKKTQLKPKTTFTFGAFHQALLNIESNNVKLKKLREKEMETYDNFVRRIKNDPNKIQLYNMLYRNVLPTKNKVIGGHKAIQRHWPQFKQNYGTIF